MGLAAAWGAVQFVGFVLVLVGSVSADEMGPPYLREEFRPLMEAVTLHVGFDSDTLAPDMAEGAVYEPRVFASAGGAAPQFAAGLIGRALVLGTGGAVYPRRKRALGEPRGDRDVDPASAVATSAGRQRVFTMTSNARFYLERQGPNVDADGRVRRHEGILYLAFLSGVRGATLDGGGAWENGQWYLLVANWSWPTMELSVNGQPFAVRRGGRRPARGGLR